MNLIVMKFGGTSVANIKKINNVADIVEKEATKKKDYSSFVSNGRCYKRDAKLY